MTPDTRVSDYWYVNGEEWSSYSETWDEGEEGSLCWYIFTKKGPALQGLDEGNWKTKIFIGNELVQEGEFYISR
jgi:hypothetical protein